MKKMMQNWTKYLALVLLFVVPCMVSCSDDDNDNGNNNGGGSGQISLPSSTVTSIPVSATAGERALIVNFGDAWSAKLDKNVTWLDVNPKSGDKGVQTLTLKVKDNETFANQSTDLTFTVGSTVSTLKIVQDAAEKSIRVYENEIVLTEDTSEITLQRVITNVTEIEVASYPSWIESVELTPVVEGAFTAKIKLKAGDFDSEVRNGAIVFKEKGSDFSAEIPVRMKSPDDFSFISCPESILGYDQDGKIGTIKVEIATAPNRDMKVVCYDYNNSKEEFYDGEASYYAPVAVKQPQSKAAFTNTTWAIDVICDGGTGEFIYDSRTHENAKKTVSFGVFVIPAETDVADFNPNAEGVKYQMVTITPADRAEFVEISDITLEGDAKIITNGNKPNITYNTLQGGQVTFSVKTICPVKIIMGTQDPSILVSEDECGIRPDDFFTLSDREGTTEGIYTIYNYTLTIPEWTNAGEVGMRNTTIYIFETTKDGKFIVSEEYDSVNDTTEYIIRELANIRVKQLNP